MGSFRSILLAALLLAILFGATTGTIRRYLPAWWRQRGVRLASFTLIAVTLFAFALWAVGLSMESRAVTQRGVSTLWRVAAVLLPLTVALPFAALVAALGRRLRRRDPVEPPPPPASSRSISRRHFLEAGAASLPAFALASSASGLVSAGTRQRMPVVRFRFPELHRDLDGLKILHLTDLHLGFSMDLSDVESVLLRASEHRPDLIVFTGDIADDMAQLRPALDLAAQAKPRLGVFAVAGNHEYFRGIQAVRAIFDRSPVRLLVDDTAHLDVGQARLDLLGADDPRYGRRVMKDFLRKTVDRTLDRSRADAFRLLLSHRPDGFTPAAASGIPLTLAGHTHGGQLGLFGRSAFDAALPQKYLWGKYTNNGSQLYTSSGFGHWLPFRLNCPTEAPIIVLGRA